MWTNIAAWKLYGLWFIPNTLTTANCMHVALLVLIRLIDLEMPVKNEEIHTKLRLAGVISIWTVSAIVCAIPVISAPFSETAALITEFFIIHGCHTFPICLIVIIYLRIIWTISQTRIRGISDADPAELPEAAKYATERINSKKNEMFRMITGNVIRLIICYVPYIVAWHIHVEIDFRGTCELTAEVGYQTIKLVMVLSIELLAYIIRLSAGCILLLAFINHPLCISDNDLSDPSVDCLGLDRSQ